MNPRLADAFMFFSTGTCVLLCLPMLSRLHSVRACAFDYCPVRLGAPGGAVDQVRLNRTSE
jgi:hypothetical protein